MDANNVENKLIWLYRINVKSKKYYMKIIFDLVDLSAANTWLLYRHHYLQFNIQKKNTLALLTSPLNVVESLVKSATLLLQLELRYRSVKLSIVERSTSARKQIVKFLQPTWRGG
ncbi:unnamed protein product [Adineta ricciae]|uniref:PiggyBac transposable element-derived protein domain-containing protein n=1 Tax=Adineta ricciae TaxID=249248 RepID=A0A815P0Q9_ADIRI|nr:unnamed protein product [Adineta ricciae]CAF1442039.1 unnamed protein product [Adineta ricciae]